MEAQNKKFWAAGVQAVRVAEYQRLLQEAFPDAPSSHSTKLP